MKFSARSAVGFLAGGIKHRSLPNSATDHKSAFSGLVKSERGLIIYWQQAEGSDDRKGKAQVGATERWDSKWMEEVRKKVGDGVYEIVKTVRDCTAEKEFER